MKHVMISAHECAPTRCLDCEQKLSKPKYGKPYSAYRFSVIHILCACGAWYCWSHDETHFNGGIWRRKHLLPIFDDSKRIELTKEQIRYFETNHSQRIE